MPRKIGIVLFVLGVLSSSTDASALGCSNRSHNFTSAQEVARDSQLKSKSNDELRSAAVVHPEPEYPPLAKAARVSGNVEVEITIDQEGRVISARAVSGHPLLKDSATAASKQWRFDPKRLSQTPTALAGTLTFVFDLVAAQRKNKEHSSVKAAQFTNNVSICREELRKPLLDSKKLAIALANLAASVYDENTIDKAINLFEEAERQKEPTTEASPYYAELLVQKYNVVLDRSLDKPENSSLSGQLLSPALQIFLEAYSNEAGKELVDGRKLEDIGWRIGNLYERLGRKDEAIQWFQSMLNSPGLTDGSRAAIAYYLGVHYWRKAYDLTSSYTRNHELIPDAYIPQIRQWLSDGHSYIELTHSLAPRHANSFFYEKLLVLIDLSLETDPDKRTALNERARQFQDQFTSLIRESREAEDSSNSSYAKPYVSGFPSLNFLGLAVLAPPPPPPPPPPPTSPDVRPPRW